MQITNHKTESHPEENIKDNIHEQKETVASYEQTPEASRGNQTMAGRYYTFHAFLTGVPSEPLNLFSPLHVPLQERCYWEGWKVDFSLDPQSVLAWGSLPSLFLTLSSS